MFIRVGTSESGVFDIVVGPKGHALVSNGETVAPSFQAAPVGKLPGGFSYTQAWELEMLTEYGGYDFGLGNFVGEFERTMLTGSTRQGPACFTTASDFPYSKRI